MLIPADTPRPSAVLYRPDISYFHSVEINPQGWFFRFFRKISRVIPRMVCMVRIFGLLLLLHPNGDIEVFIILRHPSEIRMEFHIVCIVRLYSGGTSEENYILPRAVTLG